MSTTPLTDEEIVRAVRAVAALEEQREALAARVEALRTATSPEDLAERDRAGAAMTSVTAAVLLESADTLDRLGLTTAAQAVRHLVDEEDVASDL
ncbi:hypothetical protein ACFPM3_03370 [Streptomyces coeruleoprunus]|uniref:ANTAR domain-containing protein n=1 Tax=Streptomyces coeruleoprunus TaxID=285563 RepID=A0ABV9XAE5_9ACTN